MFNTILIANRGEIACRVARTCNTLGIATVAVYSDADAKAQHVQMCSKAYRLGPAPAQESYLRVDALIEAALRSGAEAIHPGYGFLAENAAFAQACADASIVFIGPPVAAIRIMGSKSAAKTLMAAAGVPLTPGYHGEQQDLTQFTEAAQNIGYPVLIKASSGGGGKGMRIVESAAQLADAIAAAKREAKAAFGDDQLLIEKYLRNPRHIELQIFADQQGNTVHLFERDCSVQRRHQKVIEEAPAPGMNEQRRQTMGDAAIAAAQAVNYVGAGTVEFIVAEDGNFYFMEMNTRLQVEHPVTEMITGIDLVEWQLRVAAGEPLPCQQSEIKLRGHAVETRIYAEDPAKNFLPATGTIDYLQTPTTDTHTRIDSGVRQGDAISIYYDPMIAKLITWGEDRATALRRMHNALQNYHIVGVTTNCTFLSQLIRHPAFQAAELNTGFIETHQATLLPEADSQLDERFLLFASMAKLLRLQQQRAEQASQSTDPWSPWHESSNWRLHSQAAQTLQFLHGEQRYQVAITTQAEGYDADVMGNHYDIAHAELDNHTLSLQAKGVQHQAHIIWQQHRLHLFSDSQYIVLEDYDPLQLHSANDTGGAGLTAPMPGTVSEILTELGAHVSRGDKLMVLEAMKMEHAITAPHDGVVAAINFTAGEQVAEGAALLSLASE